MIQLSHQVLLEKAKLTTWYFTQYCCHTGSTVLSRQELQDPVYRPVDLLSLQIHLIEEAGQGLGMQSRA